MHHRIVMCTMIRAKAKGEFTVLASFSNVTALKLSPQQWLRLFFIFLLPVGCHSGLPYWSVIGRETSAGTFREPLCGVYEGRLTLMRDMMLFFVRVAIYWKDDPCFLRMDRFWIWLFADRRLAGATCKVHWNHN